MYIHFPEFISRCLDPEILEGLAFQSSSFVQKTGLTGFSRSYEDLALLQIRTRYLRKLNFRKHETHQQQDSEVEIKYLRRAKSGWGGGGGRERKGEQEEFCWGQEELGYFIGEDSVMKQSETSVRALSGEHKVQKPDLREWRTELQRGSSESVWK